MEWIKVEDALPEDDGYYITMTNATGKCRGVLPLKWVTTTVRGKVVRRWVYWGRISPWKVTHWMKMPEPPKE